MNDTTQNPVVITPEQQLDNIKRTIEELKRTRRHIGRKWAITTAEAQYEEARKLNETGKLEAIIDNGCPF